MALVVVGCLALAAWYLAASALGESDSSTVATSKAAAQVNAYDQAKNALGALESARAQVDSIPDPRYYDGRGGDDLGWSAALGGKTLRGGEAGSEAGAPLAEVSISYVRTLDDGTDEFEVRAVGRHGGVRSPYTATIGMPGEGGVR